MLFITYNIRKVENNVPLNLRNKKSVQFMNGLLTCTAYHCSDASMLATCLHIQYCQLSILSGYSAKWKRGLPFHFG